ncbi:hypothetical protein [Streptomyces sp. NBC_00328]|uniref:hypothetical protein n=1 Tax=Streptomyces sp. NBC_00328 TaxID=2903646 RepID=UPI002E2DB20F|nr:hypothetical protein [Streptomyces sp. NBC_00328]
MPFSPSPSGSARPAAVVNEEIRALVVRAGGWLYGPSRDRYEVLVAEWTVAVAAEQLREDIVKAA